MQHSTEPAAQPPVAPRRPVTTEHHGRTRVDDYEWLRAKGTPEVMAHLEAENEYTQAQTAHLADLRQSIFDEIKSRTRETDLSVPTRNRGHWYYGRSFEGKEYGATCRVPVTGPGADGGAGVCRGCGEHGSDQGDRAGGGGRRRVRSYGRRARNR